MKKSLGAKTLIYPTPVLVVCTYDEEGKPNAMTAAWGGICCSSPPCVAISLRKATYTYGNLMAKKAFTINIPSENYVREADYFGMVSGKKEDKFAKTGLTPVKSDFVDAPYISEFPVNLECKIIQVIEIGLHTQFIGEVMDVKLDDDGVGAITSYNAADLIAMPDKIIFYHKGTSTIINKYSEKYQNIVKMTKARYDGNIDMYLSAISESDIADQKQNNDAVEFVYSNKVEAHWKRVKKVGSDNESQYNIVYTSLLFPLSGNRNSWMIFLPIQNGPLGSLKSPDDLLKYLST